MMSTFETEATIQNGTLTVRNLPFQEGKTVKVIIVAEDVETVDKPKRVRKAGSAKGLIWMSDDFDDPLEDFREYME
jgi:hypothetical protein